MDNTEIIVISLIAFVINLIILFNIIRSATKADQQVNNQKKQTEILLIQIRILGHLLNKQGMSKDDVNKIINGTYKGEEENIPSIKEE